MQRGWRDILINNGKVKDEDKKQQYLESLSLNLMSSMTLIFRVFPDRP